MATFTWSHSGTGAWDDPANWSPSGGPPGIADTAVIDTSIIANPTITGNGSVDGLIVPQQGTVTLTGTIAVGGNATVATNPLLHVGQGPTLVVDGGSVTVGGTLQAGIPGSGGPGSGNLVVRNAGVLQADDLFIQSVSLSSAPLNKATGSIVVDSTSILEIGSAGTGLPGALTIDPGATMTVDTNAALGVLPILNNGVLHAPILVDTLTNYGTAYDTRMSGGSNFGTVIGGALNGAENFGTVIDGSFTGVTNQGTLIGTDIGDTQNAGTVIVGTSTTVGNRVGGLGTVWFDGPGGITFLGGNRPVMVNMADNDRITVRGVGQRITDAEIVPTGSTTGDLVLSIYGGGTTVFPLLDYQAAFLVVLSAVTDIPSVASYSVIAAFDTNPGPGTAPPSDGDTLPDVIAWNSTTGGDWGNVANWRNTVDGLAPSVAPGIHNNVTFMADWNGLVSGQGNAARVEIGGSVVFGGYVATDTLVIDSPNSAAAALVADSRLTAGQATVAQGSLNNDGGLFAVGGVLQIGSSSNSFIHGLLTTEHGGVTRVGGLLLQDRGTVTLDSLSILEIGGAGTASAGTLTVDAGTMIEGKGKLEAPSILNDGTISGIAPGTPTTPNIVLSTPTVVNHGTITGWVSFQGASLFNDGVLQLQNQPDTVTGWTNTGTILAGTVTAITGSGFVVADTASFISGGTIVAGLLNDISGGAVIQFGTRQFVTLGTNVAGHVSFGAGAEVMIAPRTGAGVTLDQFADGDEFVFHGLTSTGVTYVSTGAMTGELMVMNGTTTVATLAVDGDYTGHTFLATMPGFDSSSTYITLDEAPTIPACFAQGTCIDTVHGPVAVEDLRVGDLVATRIAPGFHPVIWLGHRSVDLARHPDREAMLPVRVRAGAIAPNVPRRDLLLSPDHAVYVEGVLIPVKHLVNGRSIAQVPAERITYWHVELDRHEVLLAEGLPAESYLDTGDRQSFANGGTVVALHPSFNILTREAQGCAPLVVTGPHLTQARAVIDRRAARGRRAGTGRRRKAAKAV